MMLVVNKLGNLKGSKLESNMLMRKLPFKMCLSTLRAVCEAVILWPFTAGNVIGINGNLRRHDGRISTSVFGMVLVALLFVVIIVNDSVKGSENSLSNGIKYTMVTLSVLGIIAIIYLSVIGFKFISSNQINIRLLEDGAVYLKIVFLWIFGLSVIIYCALGILNAMTCIKAYQFADIVFYVLLIIYIFAQLLFISCFYKYQFPHSISVHYSMLLLCAYNMSIWFYYIADEARELFDGTNSTEMMQIYGNNSSCQFENLTKDIRPTLCPAVIENCLVAVDFIVVVWDPYRKQKPQRKLNNVSRAYGTINGNSSSHEISRPTVNKALSFSLTLLFGFIVCVFMIVGFFIFSIKKTNATYYHGLEMYQVALKIVWTIILSIAFYQLHTDCRPKAKTETLKFGNFILVFSAFGFMIYNQFGLLAGYLTDVPSRNLSGNDVFVENIFNICIVYLQTVFILQSERYDHKNDNTGIQPIQNTCILLSLFNGGYWFVDSFFETRFPGLLLVQKNFYKTKVWYIIMRVVFPLGIFYRFHSATALFALFRRFKNQ